MRSVPLLCFATLLTAFGCSTSSDTDLGSEEQNANSSCEPSNRKIPLPNPDYAGAKRAIKADKVTLRCKGRPQIFDPQTRADVGPYLCANGNDGTSFPQQTPEYIIIHVIEGWEEQTEVCFASPNWGAATHYVVGRSCPSPEEGNASLWSNALARVSMQYPVLVTQMVSEYDTAKHTAASAMDRLSVGIEFEGFSGQPKFFTEEQYLQGARLVRDIAKRHNIPLDRDHIIGHYQIPLCPWRDNPQTSSCDRAIYEQHPSVHTEHPATRTEPAYWTGVCPSTVSHADCTKRTGNHNDPGPYWAWDQFLDLVRFEATLKNASCDLLADGTARVSATYENSGVEDWVEGEVFLSSTLPWGTANTELTFDQAWDETAARTTTIRWRSEADSSVQRLDRNPASQLKPNTGWLSDRIVLGSKKLSAPKSNQAGESRQFTWTLAAKQPGAIVESYAWVRQKDGRATWFGQDQALSVSITAETGTTGARITQCTIVPQK